MLSLAACTFIVTAAAGIDDLGEAQLREMSKDALVEAILEGRRTETERSDGGEVQTERSAAPAAAAEAAALPGGSYRSSCYGCTLVADVLSCRCMGRADVLPAALPPANNCSGGWHAGAPAPTPGGYPTPTVQPARYALSAPTTGAFAVLCTDSGDQPAGARPSPPLGSRTRLHAAHDSLRWPG